MTVFTSSPFVLLLFYCCYCSKIGSIHNFRKKENIYNMQCLILVPLLVLVLVKHTATETVESLRENCITKSGWC